MNSSEEKHQLFVKLFNEEEEASRLDKDYSPPEFDDQDFLEEYRDWRREILEVPARREMDEYDARLDALEHAAKVKVAAELNLSEEKQRLFRRLHNDEREARMDTMPFTPPEFDSPKVEEQYRIWVRRTIEEPQQQMREETAESTKEKLTWMQTGQPPAYTRQMRLIQELDRRAAGASK